MNKSIIFFALGIFSFSLSAYSAPQASTQDELYSEYFFCNLNDGKDLDDVRSQAREYESFAKSEGSKYMQWLLTPMHAGDTDDVDYVLTGSWLNAAEMNREWRSFSNEYKGPSGEAAGTCRRSYLFKETKLAHRRIPQDQRDMKTPFEYLNCNYVEGAGRDDLLELYRAIEAASFEFGLDGWGIHLLEPNNGFDETYTADFTLSRHWYSFDKRAEMMEKWPAWVDFLSQSGLPKKYAATLSCNNSKTWLNELVTTTL